MQRITHVVVGGVGGKIPKSSCGEWNFWKDMSEKENNVSIRDYQKASFGKFVVRRSNDVLSNTLSLIFQQCLFENLITIFLFINEWWFQIMCWIDVFW